MNLKSIRVEFDEGYLRIDKDGAGSDFMSRQEMTLFILNNLNHMAVRKVWGLEKGEHLSRHMSKHQETE